ncbi:MAG: hypothetical protein AAF206_21775 [Bacteroidota bacterium]
MPVHDRLIDELAKKYWFAEANRVPIAPLRDYFPHLSLESAYQIQQALVRKKEQNGWRAIGWRMFGVHAAARAQMQLQEPFIGKVFDKQRVPHEGVIPMEGLIHPRVSVALGLRLGSESPAQIASPEQLLESAEGIFAVLEILDARTSQWEIDSFDMVADNGVLARFVLSDPFEWNKKCDLGSLSYDLQINQRPVDQLDTFSENILLHLEQLMHNLHQHDKQPQSGQLLILSGLSAAFPLQKGDDVKLDLGFLGRATVQIG